MARKILIPVLTILLICHAAVTFAEPWSDRITVTVRGHGPDVVLIPGMTCSSAVWDATVAHLKDHFRLHLIQVDGFAGTQAKANAGGPVVQPTVDAIAAYIKAKNLKSPKVIGHSLGGTMGMMLAIQHPEDVGALMIIDSLPFTGILLRVDNAAAAAKKAAKMRKKIIKQSERAYARDQKKFLRVLVKSPAGRELATDWAVDSDKSVVAQATYDDLTIDLRQELHNAKAPVTILYAWDSKSGYAQVVTDWFYQQNYAALPNKTFVRIDNSYHFIMLDQPAAFLKQVDKFLGSQ
ncbi:MAG TPA: alpha/beta hydrolase [Candidatus Acidoferrales bacterium]|jgi:pimeloyl-ACP methyl ester carboxylesterase|nr:alpha/beta hydrolase [Candidatus Acidoferrales bacterium]